MNVLIGIVFLFAVCGVTGCSARTQSSNDHQFSAAEDTASGPEDSEPVKRNPASGSSETTAESTEKKAEKKTEQETETGKATETETEKISETDVKIFTGVWQGTDGNQTTIVLRDDGTLYYTELGSSDPDTVKGTEGVWDYDNETGKLIMKLAFHTEYVLSGIPKDGSMLLKCENGQVWNEETILHGSMTEEQVFDKIAQITGENGEEQFTYFCDFDSNGTEEKLVVSFINDGEFRELLCEVYTDDGCIGEFGGRVNSMSESGSDRIGLRAEKQNGDLYVEFSCGGDIDYYLYHRFGFGLGELISVHNPGYSAGFALFLNDTYPNDPLYEEDMDGTKHGQYSDEISALNGVFNPSGIYFKSRIAEAEPEQIIFDLTEVEFGSIPPGFSGYAEGIADYLYADIDSETGAVRNCYYLVPDYSENTGFKCSRILSNDIIYGESSVRESTAKEIVDAVLGSRTSDIPNTGGRAVIIWDSPNGLAAYDQTEAAYKGLTDYSSLSYTFDEDKLEALRQMLESFYPGMVRVPRSSREQ